LALVGGQHAQFGERTLIEQTGDTLTSEEFSLGVLPGDFLSPTHFQGFEPAVANFVDFGLPGHNLISLAFFIGSQALLPCPETMFKSLVADRLRMIAFPSLFSLSIAYR